MYGLHQVAVALCFHCVDLITGLVGAIRNHELESSKMRDGIFKKVGFLLCYTLAIMVDTQQDVIGLHLDANILPIIVTYTITTEIISIIENITKINPDLLPDKLTSFFHIKKEGGKE